MSKFQKLLLLDKRNEQKLFFSVTNGSDTNVKKCMKK